MKPKLVRDKIPEIITKDDKIPKARIATDEEYWQELKNKLVEEVNEFLKDETHEELADIQEVLYAIYKVKGINKEELEAIRSKKETEKGSFKNKIILEDIKSIQK